MAKPDGVLTSIKTADALVFTGQGKVYWVTASAAATGGAAQLNDSTDDGGTDKWSVVVAANTSQTHSFDPPMDFETGIYADIPGTNVTLTIGYK